MTGRNKGRKGRQKISSSLKTNVKHEQICLFWSSYTVQPLGNDTLYLKKQYMNHAEASCSSRDVQHLHTFSHTLKRTLPSARTEFLLPILWPTYYLYCLCPVLGDCWNKNNGWTVSASARPDALSAELSPKGRGTKNNKIKYAFTPTTVLFTYSWCIRNNQNKVIF